MERRLAYLEALGVPVYVRRSSTAGTTADKVDAAAGTAGGIRPGSSLESLPVTRLVSR